MSKKTGFELIGAIAERAKNEESLFRDALKKLTNSSEDEVRKFLKTEDSHSPKNDGVLQMVNTENMILKVPALNGSHLFYESRRIIYVRGSLGLTKNYVSTPETMLRVDWLMKGEVIKKIYNILPGILAQKWLSQNQVVEITDTLIRFFPPFDRMLILCKKDEKLPVEDENPTDNLIALILVHNSRGTFSRFNTYNVPLSSFMKVNDNILVVSPL